MQGTIKTLVADRGYGFIRPDGGGADIFFHRTGLVRGLEMNTLEIGLRVAFEEADSPKGKRAEVVELA